MYTGWYRYRSNRAGHWTGTDPVTKNKKPAAHASEAHGPCHHAGVPDELKWIGHGPRGCQSFTKRQITVCDKIAPSRIRQIGS